MDPDAPVPPPPSGVEHTRKNVAVIGAGVTGVLVAHALRSAGHHVTILEAHTVCSGSSGRSAAAIRQQFTTPSTIQGMRYAVDFYRRFPDIMSTEDPLTGQVSRAPVVLRQNGYLWLYETDEEMERGLRGFQTQRAAGLEEVRLLDPSDLRAEFPYVRSDRMVGGRWCPTDGFLHPDTIVMTTAEKVRSMGVPILQNAPVTRAERLNGKITAVHTPKGTVECDVVVNATNLWARATSMQLGGSALPIEPVRRYLYFLNSTGNEAGCLTKSLPFMVTPKYAYARPDGNFRLMLGWAHETPPDWSVLEDHTRQDFIEPQHRKDRAGEVDCLGTQMWNEVARCTTYANQMTGFVAVTTGMYGVTPDINPFIAYDPRVENLVHAAGFSGHGMMHAPFTAAIVRKLVEAERNLDSIHLNGWTIDLSTFRVDRDMSNPEGVPL